MRTVDLPVNNHSQPRRLMQRDIPIPHCYQPCVGEPPQYRPDSLPRRIRHRRQLALRQQRRRRRSAGVATASHAQQYGDAAVLAVANQKVGGYLQREVYYFAILKVKYRHRSGSSANSAISAYCGTSATRHRVLATTVMLRGIPLTTGVDPYQNGALPMCRIGVSATPTAGIAEKAPDATPASRH